MCFSGLHVYNHTNAHVHICTHTKHDTHKQDTHVKKVKANKNEIDLASFWKTMCKIISNTTERKYILNIAAIRCMIDSKYHTAMHHPTHQWHLMK